MPAKQGMSWTVSVGGRRALRGVAVSLVGGTFLAHYLPHTLLLDKTKGVTQAYRKGIAVPVADCVKSLVEEVMGEMAMGQEEMGCVAIYTNYGYDFFHAGSVTSSHGALLGVPASFKWNSVEEFDGAGVVVNNTPVPWNSPPGQALRDSLILTRNAKKFVIARELDNLRTAQPLLHGATPAVALTVAYSISLGINSKLNLYARPRALRVCLYLLAGLFGYSVYVLATDMATVRAERDGDGAAAAMGKAYAEGGVEFYSKILARNVALRQLMGKDGEKLFTVMGNDEVLFRTKHLPYSMRLDALKKHLENYTATQGDGQARDGGRGGEGGEERGAR